MGLTVCCMSVFDIHNCITFTDVLGASATSRPKAAEHHKCPPF